MHGLVEQVRGAGGVGLGSQLSDDDFTCGG